MSDVQEIPRPPEEALGYTEKAGDTPALQTEPRDDPGNDGSE